MKILQRGDVGLGLLVEYDAGYIASDITTYNKELFSGILKEAFEAKPDQVILVDCILQKWGIENRNGRIYPKDVLVPQVEKYMIQVKDNSAVSEADHPDTSVVSLLNIAHIIKDMWWGKGKDENILYGKLELVVTQGYLKYGIASMVGDKILEYLRRGVKLGISSRGIGSLEIVDGKNIVQKDFELICFDLVASPSTPGAYLYPSNSNLEQQNKNSVKEEINIKGLELHEALIFALDKFLI